MVRVDRVKIIGSNCLSGNSLAARFAAITCLDISDTEMPKMYIEDLIRSFPQLEELNLGSYTYDGWDSHEEYLQNVALDATSSAFGGWMKDLCRLTPRVTLAYEYQIVMRTDVILRELMGVSNLEVVSINLAMENISFAIFHDFLEGKNGFLFHR